ncbi:MAG: hypothetical protein P9L98_01625 [Candidatus Kaelpia imicola]|nr:hypothetical protein [Candidatus Kaelpia imicola]
MANTGKFRPKIINKCMTRQEYEQLQKIGKRIRSHPTAPLTQQNLYFTMLDTEYKDARKEGKGQRQIPHKTNWVFDKMNKQAKKEGKEAYKGGHEALGILRHRTNHELLYLDREYPKNIYIGNTCGDFVFLTDPEDIQKAWEIDSFPNDKYVKGKRGKARIEVNPLLETEIEKPTILTQNNSEYIRFFKKTEDLDYKCLTDFPEGFGIQEPSNGFFKDLYSVPIKEQDDLKNFIKKNKNVLITGKSKVGKTRLVFDVLRKLKNCYVLALKSSTFRNVDTLKISDYFNQKRKKLIWFIDNIDYYPCIPLQDPIWDIYEKLYNINKNTIIIATLRSDETKPKSRLLEHSRIEPLEFRNEIENTEADDFMNHYYNGKQLPLHYDKTFWSIMFDIEYMKDIYNNSSKVDENSRSIMKSLKLLQIILPIVKYTLLKLTFENIYYAFQGTTVFDDGIRKLEKLNFLKIDKTKNAVSSQEPYLKEIVYYPDMDLDMKNLIKILTKHKKFVELLCLGTYYYSNKNFNECSKCNQLVANSSSSNESKSVAYCNWGVILSEIAELQDSKEEQKKYYDKACKKYEKAIDYKKDNAKAYSSWGNALSQIAELQDSKEEQMKYYNDASNKYEKSIEYKKDCAETYCNWGAIFFKIAKLQDSKKEQKEYYDKACKKYEKAIDCEKDNARAYYNWGFTLSEIAELQDSKEEQMKYYNDASNKYEKSIEHKKDCAETYCNWGVTLSEIAELQDSKEKQMEYYNNACKKYKKAIKYKKDYAEAYSNWGATVFKIAELQNSKEEQEKRYRTICALLSEAYILFVLQNKRNLTYTPIYIIKNISKKIKNPIHIAIISIFELGLKVSSKNKKSFSNKELDFLQEIKGISSASDIVIDAILENKKPDVAEIPNDSRLLRTAVYIANKIIAIKNNK